MDLMDEGRHGSHDGAHGSIDGGEAQAGQHVLA